jgi:uncharacterized protein with GYD domain
MGTYISLLRFTEQGIRNVKDVPGRIDEARKRFEQAGGKLKEWYLAMGKYDIVIVSEAPDDEAMARAALSVGLLGNVRTETMRVFSEADFRNKILPSVK